MIMGITTTVRLFAILGCVNAALAVSLGAFGAHALKSRLSTEMLEIYQTAVQYHFYHALGLFAVAFMAYLLPDAGVPKWAGWLMLGGIVLFSGSLYVLALTGTRWLGAITPLGGMAFIAAWLLLTGVLVLK